MSVELYLCVLKWSCIGFIAFARFESSLVLLNLSYYLTLTVLLIPLDSLWLRARILIRSYLFFSFSCAIFSLISLCSTHQSLTLLKNRQRSELSSSQGGKSCSGIYSRTDLWSICKIPYLLFRLIVLRVCCLSWLSAVPYSLTWCGKNGDGYNLFSGDLIIIFSIGLIFFSSTSVIYPSAMDAKCFIPMEDGSDWTTYCNSI